MSNYVEVILTIPKDTGFTYRIPPNLRNVFQLGCQVIVPFGKKYLSGIVYKFVDKNDIKIDESEIKDISDLVFEEPIVSQELLSLIEWISDYYICHLGEAFRLVQSSVFVSSTELQIKRNKEIVPDQLSKNQRKVFNRIPVDQEISFARLKKQLDVQSLNAILIGLEKKGAINRRFSGLSKKSIHRSEEYFKLNSHNQIKQEKEEYLKIISKKTNKLKELIEFLQQKQWVTSKEIRSAGFTRNNINLLLKKNLLLRELRKKNRIIDLPYIEKFEKIICNKEQKEIIKSISGYLGKNRFKSFLLHGITGSGKTQIYIELIKNVLDFNKHAIVLIPEIVLTPQTLTRFRHYFSDSVAIIHSRLSVAEKREILYGIRQGYFKIVLGPRSAIFAPLQNIGLIIVDEEHESSYKQTDAKPHYNARDVAVYRAKLNKAVVVLGSATPSFESLSNADCGNYGYYHLKQRVEKRKLPRINIVDLREDWKKKGQFPIISEHLELKIESRLLMKEQIMLLQNQRGYSPYILCKDCGYIQKCPNCEITLTYHQVKKKLICHYCAYEENAPDICPECNGVDLLYRGIGTQRLEEQLNQDFANARLLRMDQDTTRGKYGHLNILNKFRTGEADILLGTKMIAKGLDFNKVTLVGIPSADQGMNFPDFRSPEKTFQLLTQAAGRAGRGPSNGEVVVQSFNPTNILFKYLLTHNYKGFYESQLESRKILKYPPFSRLILIRIEGAILQEVQKYSRSIGNFLWKVNKDKIFTILGPAPSPIAKIQNNYRFQILIKQEKKKNESFFKLKRLLKDGILKNVQIKKWPVKINIDVDPLEIM